MSAYSPPTRRIPSCSSDYPQCEAKAHTLFPLPSHQIKTQNLSFLKRHRQIFSFRVLKRQILLPFAQKQMKTLSVFAVALHPEGVDRNCGCPAPCGALPGVALHPEGVDRNISNSWVLCLNLLVALHPEGVDRNCEGWEPMSTPFRRSPSTRRAWIEICLLAATRRCTGASPSTRRAWIEMGVPGTEPAGSWSSPSTRRAWIEIAM